MLRFILNVLIDRYGIFAVNNSLAEIFDDRIDSTTDEELSGENKSNDDLSEAYDAINRELLLKDFNTK